MIGHVDRIWRKNKRSILDYAVYYREKYPQTETYAQYMSLVTCHCIVQADFLSPDVFWEVVPFVC